MGKITHTIYKGKTEATSDDHDHFINQSKEDKSGSNKVDILMVEASIV